jgi:hypothetical protein
LPAVFFRAPTGLERSLDFIRKSEVMFPMWFFMVLIVVICYLFYLTRTTEESFIAMSRNHFKKFQFRTKNTPDKPVQ